MTSEGSSDTHPPWFDPRRPARNDSVLPFILERNAEETPDRACFRFADGEAWTCAETLLKVRLTAGHLVEHGVTSGDFVLTWLPSGQAIIRTWFAINYLGAIFVPINVDYRGRILGHAVRESRARVLIAHPQLVSRLDAVEDAPLTKVLSVGAAPALGNCAAEVVVTDLEGSARPVSEAASVDQWDPQMVIFTSGTTGPSKGVVCPYLQMYTVGQASYGYMTESDCMLVELPMFHVGGVSPIMGALANRATIGLYDGFKTDQFWDRIRECGATTTSGLIGSMASFLAKAPESADDADNPLRMLTLMLNKEAIAVARRYGFHYISGFNMTELSVPLVTEVDCTVPGSLGRPRSGCECRVVDEHDHECDDDEVGELIVRTDQPWTVNSGYLNRPETTAEAWRNGWFHTGDLVRRDASGNFFFIDRLKDAVRRRGENVSSIEVESDVLSYGPVAEAAVVAVPSEHGDQEILVAVVAKPGMAIEPRKLAEHLVPLMPHYMVPRYIRVMDELPKTPTNKVMKVQIRDAGITDDTWDREAADMKLKRTRLR